MRNCFWIICLVLLASCSSSIVYKSLEDMPTQPKYSIAFAASDTMNMGIMLNQTIKVDDSDDAFINKINKVRIGIYASNKILDSIETNKFNFNQIPFGSNSISKTFSTALSWIKPKFISANMLRLNIMLFTDKVIYTGEKALTELAKNNNGEAGLALELTPIIEIKNDSMVAFTVKAKRNFLLDNEYFPNSEMLRVEITSMSGKILYMSNYNNNYFQVIKKVMPEEIGNIYEYKAYWNGKDNNNTPLPAGRYNIRFILASKPNQYIETTILEWRNK